MEYETKEEVLEIAQSVIGRRIGDYDVQNKLMNTQSKGRVGHVMESMVYNYDLNNDKSPDFKTLGIELKTTGYRWVHKGKYVSAKERLVITMIDYFNDINIDFYDSHCFSKIDEILLILYEYEDGKDLRDMIYTNYYLYEYDNIPEKDKLIIENDWETIMGKIRSGNAHELSEGDTMYLGACTKGANSNSLVKQPFSNELAMSRAFSLKTKYMTSILRNKVFHNVENREQFITDLNLLKDKSFEEIIMETLNKYKGMSLDEIDMALNIKVNRNDSKQFLYSYTMRMLNMSGENPNNVDEFAKANIEVKTIRLEENGNLKESMSFPAFDFIELSKETWESAQINEFFSTTKFLFMVFQKNSQGSLNYIDSFFWNMKPTMIETDIRAVWEETHRILNDTIKISIKSNRMTNNFPKTKFNRVAHVRNHGSNREDTSKLPETTKILIDNNDGSVNLDFLEEGKVFSKMCFWLNAMFVKSLINL